MKLFKKAVATVLAAVLALSMLTACGGGGSASAGNLTAQNFGGSYTIKYSCVDVNGVVPPAGSEMAIDVYLTTNGSSIYQEEDGYGLLVIAEGADKGIYILNTVTKKYLKEEDDPAEYGDPLPMATTMESGKVEYKGKSYQAESLVMPNGWTFSYCYENGKPVYMIMKTGEDTVVVHVDEFSRTADTAKLSLNGYTKNAEGEPLFPHED